MHTGNREALEVLELIWGKCQGGAWCGLMRVDVGGAALAVGGVYVIWHAGSDPKTVYVGQGAPIRDRLQAHRSDSRITAYQQHDLLVTWAAVDARQRDGVEHYLADQLSPLVGEAHPTATPIPASLPW